MQPSIVEGAALPSVRAPLPRISSCPLQHRISSLPCQKQGTDHSHCLSGPHSDGYPLLLLLDPASSLGRCQTMSAAPSQPFLAGDGPWDAASSFLGLGTNGLRYPEASQCVEHFVCQGTAATGTRCAQTSVCSSSPKCPSLLQGLRCSSAPQRLWRATCCRAKIQVKTPRTNSPSTNQRSPPPSCKCWADRPGSGATRVGQSNEEMSCQEPGSIRAVTSLVCALTWDSWFSLLLQSQV